MTNQHTDNHNDAFTFHGALRRNGVTEGIVERRGRVMDEAALTPIPWKQIHRANVPHLARRSN
ncbi:hypothetical protein [Alicyclobacillus kakegawensis]|uniref:hypothetical protein n=1 Tax=Alicyclobacillus kakegawensis TaxID=392012 RepID=UPI000836C97A|nr:hypothetical protein [Alicyclobacillus kakegawensis]